MNIKALLLCQSKDVDNLCRRRNRYGLLSYLFLCVSFIFLNMSVSVDVNGKERNKTDLTDSKEIAVEIEASAGIYKINFVNAENFENFVVNKLFVRKWRVDTEEWEYLCMDFDETESDMKAKPFISEAIERIFYEVLSDDGFIADKTPQELKGKYNYHVEVELQNVENPDDVITIKGESNEFDSGYAELELNYFTLVKSVDEEDTYRTYKTGSYQYCDYIIKLDEEGKVTELRHAKDGMEMLYSMEYMDHDRFLQTDKYLLLGKFVAGVKKTDITNLSLERDGEVVDNSVENIYEEAEKGLKYAKVITADEWEHPEVQYVLEVSTENRNYVASEYAECHVWGPRFLEGGMIFYYGDSEEDTPESNDALLDFTYQGIPFTARYQNMFYRYKYADIATTEDLYSKIGDFPFNMSFTRSEVSYDESLGKYVTTYVGEEAEKKKTDDGNYIFETDLLSMGKLPEWLHEEYTSQMSHVTSKIDPTNSYYKGFGEDSDIHQRHYHYLQPGIGRPSIQIQPPVVKEFDVIHTLVYEGNDLVERAHLRFNVMPSDYSKFSGLLRDSDCDKWWIEWNHNRTWKYTPLHSGSENDYMYIEVVNSNTGENVISPLIVSHKELIGEESKDEYGNLKNEEYVITLEKHYGHWYEEQVNDVLKNPIYKDIQIYATALYPFRLKTATSSPSSPVIRRIDSSEESDNNNNISENGIVEASEKAPIYMREVTTHLEGIGLDSDYSLKVGTGFIEVYGKNVVLYSVDGKKVSEGSGIHNVAAGIYIVRIDGIPKKVIVR